MINRDMESDVPTIDYESAIDTYLKSVLGDDAGNICTVTLSSLNYRYLEKKFENHYTILCSKYLSRSYRLNLHYNIVHNWMILKYLSLGHESRAIQEHMDQLLVNEEQKIVLMKGLIEDFEYMMAFCNICSITLNIPRTMVDNWLIRRHIKDIIINIYIVTSSSNFVESLVAKTLEEAISTNTSTSKVDSLTTTPNIESYNVSELKKVLPRDKRRHYDRKLSPGQNSQLEEIYLKYKCVPNAKVTSAIAQKIHIKGVVIRKWLKQRNVKQKLVDEGIL